MQVKPEMSNSYSDRKSTIIWCQILVNIQMFHGANPIDIMWLKWKTLGCNYTSSTEAHNLMVQSKQMLQIP